MYQWRKQARPAGRLLADLGPRLPQNSIYLFLNNKKKKSKSRRVVEGSASLDGIYRWAGRGDRWPISLVAPPVRAGGPTGETGRGPWAGNHLDGPIGLPFFCPVPWGPPCRLYSYTHTTSLLPWCGVMRFHFLVHMHP